MVFSNLPQGPLPVPFSYDLSMVSPFKDTSIDGLESLLVNPIAVCFRLLPPLWSLTPLAACLFKGLAADSGSGPSAGGSFYKKPSFFLQIRNGSVPFTGASQATVRSFSRERKQATVIMAGILFQGFPCHFYPGQFLSYPCGPFKF
jgi:hypothetical protein